MTHAQNSQPIVLKVVQVPLVVNNKKTEVYDIVREDGQEGFAGMKGQDFNVLLKNDTKVPISIHWHGLILPNNQDGVAYVTQLPIKPGESQHYRFPLLQSGTYWMHSHFKFHEQTLMAAPLIIQDPKELYQGYKDVVVMLQDFSFTKPEKIFTDLKHAGMAMDHGSMSDMKMPMQQDLNDVKYDAFLANRRTINQPDIINVTPGEKIRLRLIDASSATNYWIHIDNLEGTLIAVDGEYIKPIKSKHFQLALAQRIDVLVTIPNKEGVYPVFAQVEGTKQRSGILLVTPKAKVVIPPTLASMNAPALNDQQEKQLHALQPLPTKKITNVLNYSLEGKMEDYVWTINKEAWPHVTPLVVKKGDRVEMVFTNNSDMSHPMHLHGHVFQVTTIDGKTISDGPLRDTILVLPHSTKKIVFDAENPGIWPMHCHVLYHMHAGMMTTTNYLNYPEPDFYKDLLSQKEEH